MKYNVHLFAVVRVKVEDIEAESHKEAMEKAENAVELFKLFQYASFHTLGGIRDGISVNQKPEFADEISHYLVDEAGDEEFGKSQFYNQHKEPLVSETYPDEFKKMMAVLVERKLMPENWQESTMTPDMYQAWLRHANQTT